MKGKYKLTGFARFIIFLAFMTPVCYLGGPLVIGLDIEETMDDFKRGYNEVTIDADTNDQEEIKDLRDDIEDLKDELEDIESELSEKELLLKELLIELQEV